MPVIDEKQFGGANREINKDSWVNSWIKKSPWKIEINEFDSKLSTEADTIRTKLKEYTGMSISTFPKVTGLPRKNQLKVYYGSSIVWDYGQEQRFPEAHELIGRIGLHTFNWIQRNKI